MSVIKNKYDAGIVLLIWSAAFIGIPAVYFLFDVETVKEYIAIIFIVLVIGLIYINRLHRYFFYTIFMGTVSVLLIFPLEALRVIRK